MRYFGLYEERGETFLRAQRSDRSVLFYHLASWHQSLLYWWLGFWSFLVTFINSDQLAEFLGALVTDVTIDGHDISAGSGAGSTPDGMCPFPLAFLYQDDGTAGIFY